MKKKPEMLQNVTLKKKAMLRALEATLGVVAPACKEAGVERVTHYRWMQKDKAYGKQVEAIADTAIDFAESKLFSNIKNGDTTSIIFYLKTKGKKRGYVEKTEQDTNLNLTGSIPISAWIDAVIEK
jgi:hypothetical protein